MIDKGYTKEHVKMWMDWAKSEEEETAYYELKVPAGTYFADNIFGLLWVVFKHRCRHLFKHKIWMD